MAAALAQEYNVTVPRLSIPKTSPNWVQNIFPALLQSLYNCFNDALKQLTIWIYESMENMQHQVNNLESILLVHSNNIASLKEALRQKDYVVQEQVSVINNLQQTVNKNETYSRKDNLIFRGFDKNDVRSCDTIIRQDVFQKLLQMNDQQAAAIKYVRCHYIKQGPMNRLAAIIVRFDSFHNQMLVWNKRRSMKKIYVAEDFPAEVARKRKRLRPILKAASKIQQYEKSISIKNDKLLFNGELLSVDELQKLPEAIHPRTQKFVQVMSWFLGGLWVNFMNWATILNAQEIEI